MKMVRTHLFVLIVLFITLGLAFTTEVYEGKAQDSDSEDRHVIRTAPFDNCDAWTSENILRDPTITNIIAEGFSIADTQCDSDLGMLRNRVVAFGGQNGSVIEGFPQEADAYNVLVLRYVPQYTGVINIEALLTVSAIEGAVAGSATALPDVRGDVETALEIAADVPTAITAFLQIARTVVYETGAGVIGEAYIAVTANGETYDNSVTIGEHGVVASFPIPPWSQKSELANEEVPIGVSVPVTDGNEIMIKIGIHTNVKAFGWALAHWNLGFDQESLLQSVSISYESVEDPPADTPSEVDYATAIIGVWQDANGNEIEFSPDGVMRTGTDTLSYSVVDDLLLLTVSSLPVTQYQIASLTYDELRLAQGDISTNFQRVGNTGEVTLPEEPQDSGEFSISYGSVATGELTLANPMSIYWFSGSVGDMVSVTMDAMTSDLDPTLAIADADGNILAQNDDADGLNSRIDYSLPLTGMYRIMAGSYDRTLGQFRLELWKSEAGNSGSQTPSVSGSTDLPHFGMFLIEQGELRELLENRGGPPPSGVPSTTNTQPTIYVWDTALDLSQLSLSPINGRSIDYSARPLNGGVIEIHPNAPLSTGRYCFVESNMFTPYTNHRNWCFDVDNFQSDSYTSLPPSDFVLDQPGVYLYTRGNVTAIPLSNSYRPDVSDPTSWAQYIPQTTDASPVVMMWLFDIDTTRLHLDQVRGGIGVDLDDTRGRVTITNVSPRSPALIAGVMAGDVITAIDGRAVQSVESATSLLRGLLNTTTRLTLMRGTQTMEVALSRAEIWYDPVSYELTPWNSTTVLLRPVSPLAPGRYCYEEWTSESRAGIIVNANRWCFDVVTEITVAFSPTLTPIPSNTPVPTITPSPTLTPSDTPTPISAFDEAMTQSARETATQNAYAVETRVAWPSVDEVNAAVQVVVACRQGGELPVQAACDEAEEIIRFEQEQGWLSRGQAAALSATPIPSATPTITPSATGTPNIAATNTQVAVWTATMEWSINRPSAEQVIHSETQMPLCQHRTTSDFPGDEACGLAYSILSHRNQYATLPAPVATWLTLSAPTGMPSPTPTSSVSVPTATSTVGSSLSVNLDDWTLRGDGGTWYSTTDGLIGTVFSGIDSFYVASTTYSDFAYEATLTIADGSATAAAGVIFRSRPDPLDGSYLVRVSVNNGGEISLVKFFPIRQYQQLAIRNLPIGLHTQYTIRVVADGVQIDIYLNGELVLQAVDTSFTDGAIGLNVNSSTTNFTPDFLIVPMGESSAITAQEVLANSYCPEAPRSRMRLGVRARVTYTDGSPTRLRSRPTTTAEILMNMPEGYEFDVIGGPECAEGYVWWQVQTSDAAGWVAEGNASRAFIEPIPDAVP